MDKTILRILLASLWLVVGICGGSLFAASLSENILSASRGGVLETYGSQHNSYPATRVHDGNLTNDWLSANNNANNFFIFSFEEEAERVFNFFRILNYGNHNRSVRQFRLYSSMAEAAKTDRSHDSWEIIGVLQGGSENLYNYLNRSLGGKMEAYGSQHNSYPATRVHDGGISQSWLSANHHADHYFIFSFENEMDAVLSSLHLTNYGDHNRSVRHFMIKTSTDPGAALDPRHASWVSVAGALGTDKVNLVLNDLAALEAYGTQHNSYPATRVNDGSLSQSWLSANNATNNYFIFSLPLNEIYTVDSLVLHNYGVHDRSVRNFRIFVSTEDAAAADPAHPSWTATSGISTDLANLLAAPLGGKLEAYSSQHNSYPATRVHDENLIQPWLSADNDFNNYLIFSFPDGGMETFNQLDLYNYGANNRSVRHFQIYSSNTADAATNPSHNSWSRISGNATATANLLLKTLGAELLSFGSQHGSYPASRTHDGGFTNAWLSANHNTDNYFIYGYPGNSQETVSQVTLTNYGAHDRSVRNFKILISGSGGAATNPNHNSWNAVTGSTGTDLLNLIGQNNGAVLEAYGSQHGSYPASRVNDLGLTAFWLSANDNAANYFIFSMLDGDPVDVDTLVLHNYGVSDRSIQDLRIFTSTDNSARTDPDHGSWTAVTGTADASLANLLNRHLGTVLSGFSSAHASYPAARVHDGGLSQFWLSENGSHSNQHFIFTMPGGASKTMNQFHLTNYGAHDRSVREFTLWVSSTAAAAGDAGHASWAPVEAAGGGTTFTAARAGGEQVFDFDQNYTGIYFMLRIANNYGDGNYTGFYEAELYGTDTLADYGALRAARVAGEQVFTFDNQPGQSFLMVRVLSNYGDAYTGCYEMQAFGSAVTGDYGIFTAARAAGQQVFTFDPVAGRYLQFRILDNYGDSYTGLNEIQASGTKTLGSFGVFEADRAAGKQIFAIPDTTSRYFLFKILENYGDSYTGLNELQLFGTKTVGEFAGFTAARASGPQEFTFTPVETKYVQVRILNNYGDSYTGLNEIEVYGELTLADLGIFAAAKSTGVQVFPFEERSARYLLFQPLTNYGDSYTGVSEIEAYGSATLSDHHVFEASRTTGFQEYLTEEGTGKYFKMEIASNYGDSYTGFKEIELYAVFDLLLRDPVTLSETLTRRSVTSGQSIQAIFQRVASDVTHAMLSEDGGFTGVEWVPVTVAGGTFTLNFTLSAGDGVKTVHARVRNAALDEESNFQTIRLDTTPPAQASQFTAVAGNAMITLTWQNPPDDDFTGVMIRFATNGYPATVADGILLNQFLGGKGESFTIEHTGLSNGTTYYYSLFTFDEAVNYSAPMQVQALPLSPTAGFGIQVPGQVVAGETFVMRVEVYREDGSLDTAYAGSADVMLEYINPTTGTFPLSVAPLIFSQGVALANTVYPDAGQIQMQLTGNPDTELTGQSTVVQSRPAGLNVVADASVITAEAPFSLTVTPVNLQGAVTPNYRQTVTLAALLRVPDSGAGTLSRNSITMQGQTSVSGIQYSEAGRIALIVSDRVTLPGVVLQGESEDIQLLPASLSLEYSAPPPQRSYFYPEEPFTLTVTALSQSGSRLRNYRGSVSLEHGALNFPLAGNVLVFTADHAGQALLQEVSGGQDGEGPIQARDMDFAAVAGISDPVIIRYGQVRVIGAEGLVGQIAVRVVIEDRDGTIMDEDFTTRFLVRVTDPNQNDSVRSVAISQAFEVQGGEAVIQVSNTEAETILLTPMATPELPAVPGSIVFREDATPLIGQGGLRILYWREVHAVTDDS